MTEIKKTLGIIQPFYIPWKGYFDIIHDSDEFVLYNDVRYVEHSWLNRNQIKTPSGAHWLTIPVKTKGLYDQHIDQAELVSSAWAKKHFQTIRQFYSKAPFWKHYESWLADLYARAENESLIAKVNELFIREISVELGITTKIVLSDEYNLHDGKTGKLIEFCEQSGSSRYISGPAAKDYITPESFAEAGVELIWKDYSGYPEYSQQHGEFIHGVSVLDLLLSVGTEAPYYIWGWREQQ
ncbi:MAG: WbqC family protein [Oscillospiraceae bacterium]|nr:WbqC family protein [Oscillospiraceae bacterium]